MYLVDKTKGLIWRTNPTTAKCGWDEMTMQTRWDTLIRRTHTLSEDQPIWFGNPWPTRTDEAQVSAWNVLAELMHLGALESGYYAFVSPTGSLGYRFELVGWMDTVKILVDPDGTIHLDHYREQSAIEDGEGIITTEGVCNDDLSSPDGMLRVSSTSRLIQSLRMGKERAGARMLRAMLKSSLEGCK